MKLLLSLALIGCTALSAHADLSYTQTMTTSFGGMVPGAQATKMKLAFKGNSMRSESNASGINMVTISKNAGQSTIQMDRDSKTYIEMQGLPKMPAGMGRGAGPMEMTVSVKKLGVETVNGIKAPHWSMQMLIKMKTPRGPQTMNMSSEIWSSKTPYPITSGARSAAVAKLPATLSTMFGNNIKIKGDTMDMGAAYSTVPLRMKMFMNGTSISTIDTSNFSSKPLPNSLFTVPAGYRKVTQAQWDKAQKAAIMKKMSTMMKGMPGMSR